MQQNPPQKRSKRWRTHRRGQSLGGITGFIDKLSSFRLTSPRKQVAPPPDAQELVRQVEQERVSRAQWSGLEVESEHNQHLMFDHFVVCGIPPESDIDCDSASVLWKWPSSQHLGDFQLQSFASFCFPTDVPHERHDTALQRHDWIRTCASQQTGQHVFVMTGHTCLYYVSCLYVNAVVECAPLLQRCCSDPLSNVPFVTPHSPSPIPWRSSVRALCLVSRYPFFGLHFQVLRAVRDQCLSLVESELPIHSPEEDKPPITPSYSPLLILQRYHREAPLPLCTQQVVLDRLRRTSFTRPSTDEEEVHISRHCLPMALYLVPLPSLMTLLSAILLERKVLFVCSNLRALSYTVLALVPLLRPFRYQSVFLPVLPDHLCSFLDAPVPFCVGMAHLPHSTRVPDDVIQVHLMKGLIDIPDRIPPLPHLRSALLPSLSDPVEQLGKTFSQSTRRKHKWTFTSLSTDDDVLTSSTTSASTATASTATATTTTSTTATATTAHDSDASATPCVNVSDDNVSLNTSLSSLMLRRFRSSDNESSPRSSASSPPSPVVSAFESAQKKRQRNPLLDQMPSFQQSQLCLCISSKFRSYFDTLFMSFHRHCLRDLSEPSEPVSVFLSDSFLAQQSPKHVEWFRLFFQTQIFTQWSDGQRSSHDAYRSRAHTTREHFHTSLGHQGHSSPSTHSISHSMDNIGLCLRNRTSKKKKKTTKKKKKLTTQPHDVEHDDEHDVDDDDDDNDDDDDDDDDDEHIDDDDDVDDIDDDEHIDEEETQISTDSDD